MDFKEDTDDTEGSGAWNKWLYQWLIGPGGYQKIVRAKQLVKVARKIESDIESIDFKY